MKKLTKAVGGLKYGERTKRALLLMPESLFGFEPPNARGLLERLKCRHCSRMFGVSEEMGALEARKREINQILNDRSLSQRRLVEYWTWPLIGRLFKKPPVRAFANSICVEDVDSEFAEEYARIEARLQVLQKVLPDIQATCRRHWTGDAATKISHEFLGRIFAKDHYLVTS